MRFVRALFLAEILVDKSSFPVLAGRSFYTDKKAFPATEDNGCAEAVRNYQLKSSTTKFPRLDRFLHGIHSS
ncbi:hypothetical protein ED312_05670 [Sinomicrobium pectinilyticum]|uniref:Uncharacterized protein n=1 Tax=Sinomicrobium pectinilyticum TaxID=1084421 RepID=A0A3N0ERV9_SINP1|nr:hypothetical protein ED312_05670 [Sinomicrobium pectinilyticum]